MVIILTVDKWCHQDGSTKSQVSTGSKREIGVPISMAAKTHRVSTTLLSIRREKVMLWRMLTLGGMQQRRRRINVKQTTNLAKGGARVGLELVFLQTGGSSSAIGEEFHRSIQFPQWCVVLCGVGVARSQFSVSLLIAIAI